MFAECFFFGSSHLFQHDFREYEPNQIENNQNETDHETNVETTDSDEFLPCDEGFDDVFEELESDSKPSDVFEDQRVTKILF